MEAEYWILSILAIGLALVAGFIGGRMSSASQRKVEAMARERDEAREEAENVRAEVNRHFEESARMFGRLANDYRTFFQQFSRTAQNLGLSEGRARELLQQADPSLVSGRDGAAAPATGAAAHDGASEAELAGGAAAPTAGAAETTQTDEPVGASARAEAAAESGDAEMTPGGDAQPVAGGEAEAEAAEAAHAGKAEPAPGDEHRAAPGAGERPADDAGAEDDASRRSG